MQMHWEEDEYHREMCELEFRIITRDGRERWMAHACLSVLDKNGKFLGRRSSNRDITERKRVEEELQKSRKELKQRVRERTADLEERTRELEDFTYIASHDLREPLRKITTFGDLLILKARASLNEQSLDYLLRMQDAAARMDTLGLGICKKIVERHDGTLTAKSTQGEGSTFIITLPEKQRSD